MTANVPVWLQQTLEKCSERCSLTFSPDGKQLATLSEGILKIWDSASGDPIGEYKSPGLGLPGHMFSRFAPDNETIAYRPHRRSVRSSCDAVARCDLSPETMASP